ncbi:MAG: histidine--tRNA ligase, partial [Raoultibacter sp.]
ARTVCILGPEEVAEGKVKVRNMGTHEEKLIDLEAAAKFLGNFGGMPYNGVMPGIEEALD